MTQAANLGALGTNANSTGTLAASSFAPATVANSVLAGNNTFRNWIVNGGFDIWQRGTPVTGVNTWTADRFFNTNTSMTWTKSNNTLGGPCPNMCTLTGGDSSSRFRFSFELPSSTNQSPFTVGSYWTLSLYTSLNIAGRTFNIGFANNPNATTDVCSTTGTWVALGGNRYSVTLQINATNSNNYLAMRFSGPFNGPVNEGVASISVTGVQFEAGTVATEFEQLPLQVSYALCQRYLNQYVIVATTMQAMIVGSFNTTTVYSSTPLFFPVTMRTQPTITYTGTTFLNDGIGNSISSTIDAWNSFVWGTTPNTITASGLTTGKYYFLSLGGAGNYFRASAEL